MKTGAAGLSYGEPGFVTWGLWGTLFKVLIETDGRLMRSMIVVTMPICNLPVLPHPDSQ